MKRWESRTRNTEVATFDEGASNGKNLIGEKGEVERIGDGRGLLEKVKHGTVARLDCQDGSGTSQDPLVLNEVRSTQIRGNANMLYDPCSCNHGRYISEDSRKVEFATRGWFGAERGEDGLVPENRQKDEEGRITNTYFESFDMGTLVELDGFDLLDGGLCGCETGTSEVVRLEFG